MWSETVSHTQRYDAGGSRARVAGCGVNRLYYNRIPIGLVYTVYHGTGTWWKMSTHLYSRIIYYYCYNIICSHNNR